MENATKLRGLIATSLFHGTVIILLLALHLYTSNIKMEESEGLTVNFGTDLAGMGDVEPAPQASLQANPIPSPVMPKPNPVPATAKAKPVKGRIKESAPDLLTQESEAAAALKKQDNEKDLADKMKLEEKKRIEKEEREVQRQADLEVQRIEAERKKDEQQQSQVNAIKGRMGKSFGGINANGGNQGEGVTQGTGNQGDPTGTVDSKNRGPGGGKGAGISYSLNGRSISGSLTKPEYAVNEYGDVVVTITVNKDGEVIAAVPGGKGTTTTNSTLWEAARKAAMAAKFNRVTGVDAPVQKGTITYHFKLL